MSLPPADRLSKPQYEALSEFRYQLRRFLHFSEQAAEREGITPLQYQLLLHVRGFPGRDWASVGELAERLQVQHHGAVALLGRCEKAGLAERRRSLTDRRQMEVHLLPKGEAILARRGGAARGGTALTARHVPGIAHITAFNNATEPD